MCRRLRTMLKEFMSFRSFEGYNSSSEVALTLEALGRPMCGLRLPFKRFLWRPRKRCVSLASLWTKELLIIPTPACLQANCRMSSRLLVAGPSTLEALLPSALVTRTETYTVTGNMFLGNVQIVDSRGNTKSVIDFIV